ncbi:MAG: GvpL/GvpF family gas vesicle protein [Candidatus Brocadiaceae bacterium]|nr:GvpL/GvpF family gas vesicle protein [Candidatus Brocadiaceae bacterium]
MKNPYLYVYCISKDTPSLRGLRLQGIESEPVLFLPLVAEHQGYSIGALPPMLAVALSKLSWKVASLSKQVKEPGWVAKRVREHEYVVEEVMRNQAILPMKFLTLFKSEKSLLNTLIPHLSGLDHYLEHIQDKEEWSLKVYCDESRAMRHLLETDARLKEMDCKTVKTPGERYLHKKRLQEMADEGLGNTLGRIIQDIHEALNSLSVEGITLKVHEKKVTQRAEDMLLNGAFLVSKLMLEVFKEMVEELKEGYGPWGLLFELTGPWPPYNFCPSLEKIPDKVNV